MVADSSGQGKRRDPAPPLWRRQRESLLKRLCVTLGLRDKLFRLWVEIAFNQDDYLQIPPGYGGVDIGFMAYLDLEEIARRLGRSKAAVDKDLRELEAGGALDVERNRWDVRVILIGEQP